jgi:hypothetical protein
MSLLDQEMFILLQLPSSSPDFSGVRVAQLLVFGVVYCRSLSLILFLFFWSLCCLSFDLQLMNTSFDIFKPF